MIRRWLLALAVVLLGLVVQPLAAAGAPSVFPGHVTPSSVRAALANATACAQSAWTVNPSTGSDSNAGGSTAPLKTAQELNRRLAGCVINSEVVITVTGDLASTDWPTMPAIGPTGYLVWSCASGATTLTSGTLTAAVAPSSTDVGSITDTAKNFGTACNGSCIGYRLRVTSGARAGAVAWIVYSLSSTQVRISAPVVDGWIASPSTRPAPGYSSLPTAALAAGDPYVVERLPLLRTPTWGSVSADNTNVDNSRIVFDSCAFANTIQFPTYAAGYLSDVASVPYYGNPDLVAFVGSYVGGISGGTSYASLFDDYFQNNSTYIAYHYDAAVLGDAAVNNMAFYGASVLQESCGAACPYAGGNSAVEFGKVYFDGLYEYGGPLVIQPGATGECAAGIGLAGPGASGVCLHVQTGAGFVYAQGGSYACGDAGATNVGGTVAPWANFVDAGASVVRGATVGVTN